MSENIFQQVFACANRSVNYIQCNENENPNNQILEKIVKKNESKINQKSKSQEEIPINQNKSLNETKESSTEILQTQNIEDTQIKEENTINEEEQPILDEHEERQSERDIHTLLLTPTKERQDIKFSTLNPPSPILKENKFYTTDLQLNQIKKSPIHSKVPIKVNSPFSLKGGNKKSPYTTTTTRRKKPISERDEAFQFLDELEARYKEVNELLNEAKKALVAANKKNEKLRKRKLELQLMIERLSASSALLDERLETQENEFKDKEAEREEEWEFRVSELTTEYETIKSDLYTQITK